METEQTTVQEEETNVKKSLADISDLELMQVHKDSAGSYIYSARFIEDYYGIKTSRQAVYKRLKKAMVDKDSNAEWYKAEANSVLNEIMHQQDDLKLKLQAAKIILNQKNW